MIEWKLVDGLRNESKGFCSCLDIIELIMRVHMDSTVTSSRTKGVILKLVV